MCRGGMFLFFSLRGEAGLDLNDTWMKNQLRFLSGIGRMRISNHCQISIILFFFQESRISGNQEKKNCHLHFLFQCCTLCKSIYRLCTAVCLSCSVSVLIEHSKWSVFVNDRWCLPHLKWLSFITFNCSLNVVRLNLFDVRWTIVMLFVLINQAKQNKKTY